MMCYCYNDYRSFSYGISNAKSVSGDLFEKDIKYSIWFQSGRYYEHMEESGVQGMYKMKNDDGNILNFGTLENWKKYFLEPDEDRDRKLKLLI